MTALSEAWLAQLELQVQQLRAWRVILEESEGSDKQDDYRQKLRHAAFDLASIRDMCEMERRRLEQARRGSEAEVAGEPL